MKDSFLNKLLRARKILDSLPVPSKNRIIYLTKKNLRYLRKFKEEEN